MDYRKQINLIDVNRVNTPINIIGCGALGSWLVLFLLKMGFKNIYVYDFDTIEEHNLPNQAFLEKQIGIEIHKRNKLLLWIGICTFIMICVIAITIGSINEKIHPEPKTTIEDFETASITETDISTTEPLSETTTEFIIISTSEVTTNETTEKATKEVNEKTTESTTSRLQKIVYGSRTGNHYHTKDCRYANGAKMTVAEAERKGWEPCAVCNP